jgi:hypothetical protein
MKGRGQLREVPRKSVALVVVALSLNAVVTRGQAIGRERELEMARWSSRRPELTGRFVPPWYWSAAEVKATVCPWWRGRGAGVDTVVQVASSSATGR